MGEFYIKKKLTLYPYKNKNSNAKITLLTARNYAFSM